MKIFFTVITKKGQFTIVKTSLNNTIHVSVAKLDLMPHEIDPILRTYLGKLDELVFKAELNKYELTPEDLESTIKDALYMKQIGLKEFETYEGYIKLKTWDELASEWKALKP